MQTNDPKGALLTGAPLTLAELVQNALGVNRTAAIGDKMGGGRIATAGSDRGGWWGDPSWGSRLWVLFRNGKLEAGTVELARTYLSEALKPLQLAGILGDVDVSVAVTPSRLVEATIVHHQPTGDEVVRYSDLWNFTRAA